MKVVDSYFVRCWIYKSVNCIMVLFYGLMRNDYHHLSFHAQNLVVDHINTFICTTCTFRHEETYYQITHNRLFICGNMSPYCYRWITYCIHCIYVCLVNNYSIYIFIGIFLHLIISPFNVRPDPSDFLCTLPRGNLSLFLEQGPFSLVRSKLRLFLLQHEGCWFIFCQMLDL